ncbi:MAG: RrF2 family transcriptional regulator [Endomicrobiales bacterium]
MKLLTKHADYSLRALLHLAGRPGEFVPSGEIARQEGIPDRFLKRILQRLMKEGLLSSKEGVSGGVRLARAPAKIRMLDVIGIFQGPFELSACRFRKELCPNRPTCVIRRRIQGIEKKLFDEFGGITVAGLLKDKNHTAGKDRAKGRLKP